MVFVEQTDNREKKESFQAFGLEALFFILQNVF